jgi:hypothetical protein
MQVITNPENYTASLNGTVEFLQQNSYPVQGSTAKARGLGDAKKAGRLEGYCEMLAAHLTEIRCRRFLKHTHIPVIDGHDVKKNIMEPAIDMYGLWPRNQGEEHDRLFNEFIAKLADSIEGVINDEIMVAAETTRHREAVLAGEEPATEEDKGWIQAQIEEDALKAKRLHDLLG